MIPRGTPDIGWRDLIAGLGYCLLPASARKMQTIVESRWSQNADALACLSVRSGLDLLLQELAWPPGSEVLVSAVTIPDMIGILLHHGLVPVPVDIDPDTLAIDASDLHALVGAQTRAILVAHLFGSRMPLDPVIQVARQHGLFVIEDCAQAYDASAERGHPGSDASLFSFGPIKLETALGGALVRVRDRALLDQMRQRQAAYPRQHRSAFVRRVGLFLLLKALARPWLFSIFIAWCRLRSQEHDQLLNQAVRGFRGADLIPRLRYQPSAPLLRLLDRRLRHASQRRIAQRAVKVSRVVLQTPEIQRPGKLAARQMHWVVPIASADPERLVRLLWAHGFDATRKASSLIVVPPPSTRPNQTTPKARQMLEQIVYLPVFRLSEREVARLGKIIVEFERLYSAPAESKELAGS